MSKNEQRVAEMGLREEAAAVIVEMLGRLDALENLAAEKDGRPDESGHAKAKK